MLYRTPSSGGFVSVTPDSRTCALLKVGDDAAGPLFVRATNDTAVYVADGELSATSRTRALWQL